MSTDSIHHINNKISHLYMLPNACTQTLASPTLAAVVSAKNKVKRHRLKNPSRSKNVNAIDRFRTLCIIIYICSDPKSLFNDTGLGFWWQPYWISKMAVIHLKLAYKKYITADKVSSR